MRILAVFSLFALAFTAQADNVSGFCERDGKRLEFTDGIAFADARDEAGTITTTLYLTAKPLDRKALAACTDCGGTLGENTFVSPRGDLIEAQRAATADGWMEIQHVGGELDMSSIVNVMYLSADGTLTGIDGGNGQVAFETRSEQRVAGKVTTVAREDPSTDMSCDIAFDLAVGWPR